MIEVGVAGAIIVGLVEALKQTGYLTSRWASLVAVALGVIGFVFIGEGEVGIRVIGGIISGLTASGLYSGTKATLKK